MSQRTRRSGQGRVRRRHVNPREIEQRQLQPAGNAAAVEVAQQGTTAPQTATVLDSANVSPSVSADPAGSATQIAAPALVETTAPQAVAQADQADQEATVYTEPPATDFPTMSQNMFPALDRDGDGYLGDADIAAAVTDASITGRDAAVVGVLNKMTADLEELSDDEWFDENSGISLADLQAFATSESVPSGLRGQVTAWFNYYNNKVGDSLPTLYGAGGAPTVDGINQGSIGDCYFLAALGSLVKQDPTAIQKMIADNGDNTYTVTFPGRDPVTVSGPTDAELAQYVHGGSDGIWSSVLEKAFGTVRDSGSAIPHEGGDGGGHLSEGIKVLTGEGVNSDLLMVNGDDTIRERLTAAFDAGRIVTAGTAPSLFSEKTEHGLPRRHAYSVTGWDAATDTVTIRNPWGSGERTDDKRDGTDDGTFTMSIDEFNDNFMNVAYGD